MNSIQMHTKGFDETMLCLDIDLTEKDRNLCLKTYPRCQFIQPDRSKYRQLPKHTPPLKNAFFKLEIFRLVCSYDRLLFIDSDMVFVDSIQPLLDMKLRTEAGFVYHASHREYNSGLILLNKLKPTVYDKIIKLMSTMKRAHLADQTVLMQAIRRKCFTLTRLPMKWNTTKRLAKRNRDYIGLHFVGKKPWLGGERGYEEFEEVWHKYLARS